MAASGQIDQAVEDSLDMGKLVADDMELVEYIVAVGAFESLKLRLFMLIILFFLPGGDWGFICGVWGCCCCCVGGCC